MSLADIEARLADPTLTPMMRQYLEVKHAHPDALILLRMGDFFEAFLEDAVTLSECLGIALTSRSKERDLKMAGVPHHALEGYLGRLIQAGLTVVLVDQIEDPKAAKGLVRRAVTRILTPGTYQSPEADPRELNDLVALVGPSSGARASGSRASSTRAGRGTSFGLAALELASGDFRVAELDSKTALFDEIGRLSAREMLVAREVLEDPWVGELKQRFPGIHLSAMPALSREEARLALCAIFGESETAALERALPAPAFEAAALAIHYAYATQVHEGAEVIGRAVSLQHIRRLRQYTPSEGLMLDKLSREHLELFSSQSKTREGSLIGVLDEAQSAMGGRLLSRWLSYPLADPEAILSRQGAIACLLENPSALDALRSGFSELPDLERLLGRLMMARATPRDLSAIREGLFQVPKLLDAVKRLGDASPRLAALATCDPCGPLLQLLEAALAPDPPSDPVALGVFRPGYSEPYDRLLELSQNGKAQMLALEAREREATQISSLRVRHNRVFGYYLEVTKANLAGVPDRYIRKQTLVNAERFVTEELKELEHAVLSAEDERMILAESLFQALLGQVAEWAEPLAKLAQVLAELDVYAGLAHVAERRAWVRPELSDRPEIAIVEGRHPVLEPLSQKLGEAFVPNSLSLDPETRLMIITGPNMAGKSTIMRQTALIALLAHMGSYVPARSARIGMLDRIFTRVGASDDLSSGRSTFMVEMSEASDILRSATERSLVLLDEVGRGTSTFDGLSIAWAVAEYLYDPLRSLTLFATHYHELTELAEDRPGVVNQQVAVRESDGQIVFLRKLLPGKAERSYGVEVARLAGLPSWVLMRARELLACLEAERGKLHAQLKAAVSPEIESGQLSLFQGLSSPQKPSELPPEAPEPPNPQLSEGEAAALATLKALDVDALSPRDALTLLWRLKDDL